ncbi:MAG: hypothetical protein MK135_07185 [Polyangiaceae bacterium]|nr:hypothetical protein [Polyangiaceae bacterium]
MTASSSDSPDNTPDPAALFVALVIAPGTFSRNKHFDLFLPQEASYQRRRAQLVRTIVRDLTEPWKIPGSQRTHAGVDELSEALEGDRVVLRYAIYALELKRESRLTLLEAATLHYALHRAGLGTLSTQDRSLVENTLSRMTPLL